MTSPHLPLPGHLTAGELLHLAHNGSRGVQAAVAAHPNAPATLLAELAARFPAEVLSNPALPLLRLADPQLLRSWPAPAVERLTAQPQAPAWVVRVAASYPVIDVQLAAATRPDLPPDAIRTLCHSAFWTIRELMARHTQLPHDLLAELAHDADYGVRLTVTGRPDLPDDICRVLRQDSHPLVRAVMQLAELETGN